MSDLLIEIGCEELPAGYIIPALEQWSKLVTDALQEHRLVAASRAGDSRRPERSYEDSLSPPLQARTAGTPRRLAVFVPGVRAAQEDVVVEVSGPPAKVAFDANGQPTRAAIGFAKTQGVDPKDLKVKTTTKGDYCVVSKHIAGRSARDVLAEVLPKTIAAIRTPKSMRWVVGGITFARPFRMLLALLDGDVIDFELNGVRTGRETVGHPFLSPERVSLPKADWDAYLAELRKHHVFADIPERRAIIEKKITDCLAGYGSKLEDQELLDEVTNLVEFPNIVVGSFDETFLAVPEPVLVESMRSHQRYFPIRDAAGKLLPKFIAVSNRDDRYSGNIREGNERVLKARLADAQFFLHEDTRVSLESRLERLKGVTFQAQLGSYYEKVQRLRSLAETLAAQAGLPPEQRALCVRAAELCKNDLVTSMVGEFPSLQGQVGREYALRDGEPREVAEAIAEHYMPRSADGALPQTTIGCILSLAEKFDTMLGCFSVGLAPTGSQDPYALRRAAQGILRILMEREIPLPLSFGVAEANKLQAKGLPQAEGVEDRVLSFLRDRLYNYFTDKACRYDQVNAVLATGFDDVRDVRARLDAIATLAGDPGWEELVTVVQRTWNIIRNVEVAAEVDERLLEAPEEKELWQIILTNERQVSELAEQRKYVEASRLFAQAFVKTVHRFFEKVFVNVDDPAVRQNRLALMKRINSLYTRRIADLSQIVVDT